MRHSPLISVALSAALLLATAPAIAAAPNPDAAMAGALAVEVEGVDDASRIRLQGMIEAELRAALERGGVDLGEDGGPVIEVRVTLANPDMLEYMIDVDVVDAEQREIVADGELCRACPEQSVIDMVVDSAPGIFETIQSLAPEPEPEPESAPVEGPSEDTPEVDPQNRRDRDRRSRIGPLGAVGVGALTASVACGVLGGLVFGGVLQPSGPDEPGSLRRFSVSTSGGALLGAGAGLAVFGIITTAVDLTVLERRRQNKVNMVFNLSPDHAGVSVNGRF